MSSSASQKLWVAWFEDEHQVLAAVRAVRASGLPIYDVFTPYAVPGSVRIKQLANNVS